MALVVGEIHVGYALGANREGFINSTSRNARRKRFTHIFSINKIASLASLAIVSHWAVNLTKWNQKLGSHNTFVI